jgi:radical SAM superfamily enzyme YgiQ (UPF0313 family)
MKAVLVSTYELGHQPFGLASPISWLKESGIDVISFDLSVERLNANEIQRAGLVAFYLPMHTATRIAIPVIAKVRELNPSAHLCAYGLYAPMNSQYLKSLGIDSVIGGEFEAELVELANRLAKTPIKPAKPQSNGIFLQKQKFMLPDRSGLPELKRYAYLTMADGDRRTVGYTEATRGCKHLCRHCPVVPVYGGQFRIVQRDVVLSDIAQQVRAGAQHITFGDPDFFNGVGHAVKIVNELHSQWPNLTYDVTIKVEHLINHAEHLATLRDTGCLFVTTAVESVDDDILALLDKGHTRADFVKVVALCRSVGLGLNPTFVAFSPWVTLDGYEDLLNTIVELELVDCVASVQLAIRLLIPQCSRLLELAEVKHIVDEFDRENLCYMWRHSDARVEMLQQKVSKIVEHAPSSATRREIFSTIWSVTQEALGRKPPRSFELSKQSHHHLPHLSEPWYCCAEPTQHQLDAFV